MIRLKTKKGTKYKPLNTKLGRPEDFRQFQWSGNKYHVLDHKLFLRIVDLILKRKANKPMRGEDRCIDLTQAEIQPSCLSTIIEDPQTMHTDTQDEAVRKYKTD